MHRSGRSRQCSGNTATAAEINAVGGSFCGIVITTSSDIDGSFPHSDRIVVTRAGGSNLTSCMDRDQRVSA